VRWALEHEDGAFAVGAVGVDEDFAVGRDDGGEDGFDSEGAAALEEDAFPAGLGGELGEGEDALAEGADEVVELPVPGPGVMEHGLFDAEAGGEGAGGEEEFIVGRGEHGQRLEVDSPTSRHWPGRRGGVCAGSRLRGYKNRQRTADASVSRAMTRNPSR
jgi:hypothetical protein